MVHYNSKAFVGVYFKTKKEQWEVVPNKLIKQRRQGIVCLWPNVDHVEILARNNTSLIMIGRSGKLELLLLQLQVSQEMNLLFSYIN